MWGEKEAIRGLRSDGCYPGVLCPMMMIMRIILMNMNMIMISFDNDDDEEVPKK